MAVAVAPYARTESTKHSIWYAGGIMTLLATGEDTNDQYSLVDYKAVQGGEPPLHTHDNEDEAFYVLEGEVTFFLGDEVVTAKPGTWALIPQGTVHTFRLDTSEARMLIYFTPSGFERFFIELSTPVTSFSERPDRMGEPDFDTIMAAAERHGIKFVAPKL